MLFQSLRDDLFVAPSRKNQFFGLLVPNEGVAVYMDAAVFAPSDECIGSLEAPPVLRRVDRTWFQAVFRCHDIEVPLNEGANSPSVYPPGRSPAVPMRK